MYVLFPDVGPLSTTFGYVVIGSVPYPPSRKWKRPVMGKSQVKSHTWILNLILLQSCDKISNPNFPWNVISSRSKSQIKSQIFNNNTMPNCNTNLNRMIDIITDTNEILFNILLTFLLFRVRNGSIWFINTSTWFLFGIVIENSVSK